MDIFVGGLMENIAGCRCRHLSAPIFSPPQALCHLLFLALATPERESVDCSSTEDQNEQDNNPANDHYCVIHVSLLLDLLGLTLRV